LNLFSSHKLARFISTLFVPPSFTIIIFTIFAFTLESEPIKQAVTILIALVFGFIAPIVLFLILRNKGKLADQDASIKEERTIPFLIAIIFYLIGLWIMIKFDLNIISIAFWFCYISNTIITIFINKFWKISAHAMGATGPFAAVIFVFGWIGLIMLPIVIIVGWSRIELKCHTMSQVLVGSLLAFFSVYLQMFLIVKYLNM
jgi:membrane-associated phospholipid phosphatase